jgi:hypothetical protein
MKSLAGIVVLLLSLPCSAQSLWQASSVGMSPQQVKAAFPQASEPATPSELADGAVELLRLQGIEIANERFEAAFFFKDAKLTQVTLSPEVKPSAIAGPVMFNSLAELLDAKYGRKLNVQETHGLMESRTFTWFVDKTNVTLYYICIGGKDPILHVIYQVRIAAEANKL